MLLRKILIAAAVLGIVGGLPAQNADENFPLDEVSQRRMEGVVEGEMLKFEWKESKIFPGTVREVSVYVPRAYDGKTPACVAVFVGGGGYRYETVFDNLIAKGEIPVMISVGVAFGDVPGVIDPSGARHNRTFEFDTPDGQFARMLLEEIFPQVEKLKTRDGRAVRLSSNGNDRMIAGGSSCAAAAFNAAWAMPEEFSRVFSTVGSYTGLRGSYIYPTLIHKTEPKGIRVFLQSGTRDMWTAFGDWWSANNAMARALEFAGYEFDYEFGNGKHSGAHGTALFPRAMRFLWKDWPAPVKASASSRNHVLKGAVAGQGWAEVGSLPEEIPWHTQGARGAFGKIRSDKDGKLWASVMHIIRPADDGKIVPETNPPPPSRRVSTFWTTYRFLGDGKWEEVAREGRLLAFDKDGRGRIVANKDDKGVVSTIEAIDRVGTDDSPVHLTAGARLSVFNWHSAVVTTRGAVYASGNFGGEVYLLREDQSPKRVNDSSPKRRRGQSQEQVLVGSGDGNWLAGFESETTRGWSWRIEQDGSLSCGQSFYVLHKKDEDDGARAMDAAAEVSKWGYIYVATALGVQVCDANGRTAAILPLPRDVAAMSLCFGGKDFKTLYVLGADGRIYSRPMKNRGAAPWLSAEKITMKAG